MGEHLNVRLSATMRGDIEQVAAMAKAAGITRSTVVRWMLQAGLPLTKNKVAALVSR